jgi:hypothetical protein
VLTPLSLLINIATVVVCTIIVNPGIGASYLLIRVSTDFTSNRLALMYLGKVTKAHPTSISPQPSLIAIYVIAIYASQIGYCLLLVLARKPETKVSPPSVIWWVTSIVVPHRKPLLRG